MVAVIVTYLQDCTLPQNLHANLFFSISAKKGVKETLLAEMCRRNSKQSNRLLQSRPKNLQFKRPIQCGFSNVLKQNMSKSYTLLLNADHNQYAANTLLKCVIVPTNSLFQCLRLQINSSTNFLCNLNKRYVDSGKLYAKIQRRIWPKCLTNSSTLYSNTNPCSFWYYFSCLIKKSKRRFYIYI